MHNHLSFAVVRKKTPYQKHREKEEDKKRRAEEEEARLYQDFVESFRGEDEKAGPRAFVRGGTILPGTQVPSEEPVDSEVASPTPAPAKPKGQYVPSFIPPSMAAAMEADEQAKRAQVVEEVEVDESGFGNRKIEKARPKNIDLMLETLKRWRDQEIRKERFRSRKEGRSSGFDVVPDRFPTIGSFADGDPFTTNLYVGNLAPDVDEEILKREFGRFGPIASVKIMWPRDEEQRRRGSNCGFVAFMKREDAQRCQEKLNGEMLHEYELRIGWGKSVPIPPVPVYPPPNAETLKLLKHPGIAPVAQENLPKPLDNTSTSIPDIEVCMPEDGHVRYIIDSLASYVLRDGCALEQLVMEREGGSPMFRFLFDLDSQEHAYYRWRLFSLSQGDGLRSWRIEPFVMVEGGPRWVPPTMCVGDGSQLTAAQKGGQGDTVKYKCLSDLERDRFEDMLRTVTAERSNISEAMVFALDNAEAAYEVVDILVESLTLIETPLPVKVVRLFLVSDILHNSTAPVRNASQYRSRLEERLPEVFESFREVYTTLESKMMQEAVRRHVLRVLRVWRNWFIFSNDYLNGLQATFLRTSSSSQENLELLSELRDVPIEALERRCRVSGLCSRGSRDNLISRLLALDTYLNGQSNSDGRGSKEAILVGAQQQDLKGANGNASSGFDDLSTEHDEQIKVGSSAGWMAVDNEAEKEWQPAGPISKWMLQESDERQESSEKIFSDTGSTPVLRPGYTGKDSDATSMDMREVEASSGARRESEGVGGASRMDPEELKYRESMRRVEVAVMEYQEELEEGGITKGEIELKVSQYRELLRNDFDRLDTAKDGDMRGGSGHVQKERSSVRARSREKDQERDRARYRGKTRDQDRDRDRSDRDRERDGKLHERDYTDNRPSRTDQASRSRRSPVRGKADSGKKFDRPYSGRNRSRSRSPLARRHPSTGRTWY